jgi:hypothetical protein
MRVKLFHSVISVSSGSSPGGSFAGLEDEINGFLDANPTIRIKDIKLTSNAAAVGTIVTNYGLVALLLYEETGG